MNGENIEATGNELTFYQKKALRDDFRRKWNEDQGLVSIFDKRWIYKQANNRVKSAANNFNSRNIKDKNNKTHAIKNNCFMGI